MLCQPPRPLCALSLEIEPLFSPNATYTCANTAGGSSWLSLTPWEREWDTEAVEVKNRQRRGTGGGAPASAWDPHCNSSSFLSVSTPMFQADMSVMMLLLYRQCAKCSSEKPSPKQKEYKTLLCMWRKILASSSQTSAHQGKPCQILCPSCGGSWAVAPFLPK